MSLFDKYVTSSTTIESLLREVRHLREALLRRVQQERKCQNARTGEFAVSAGDCIRRGCGQWDAATCECAIAARKLFQDEVEKAR